MTRTGRPATAGGREGGVEMRLPPEGEVWIWRVPLTVAEAGEFEGSLSGDELSRAGRFVFARDRVRFVAARGWLRKILGEVLAVVPAEVKFSYGEWGKPEISGELSRSGVCFNSSHAGDAGVIAVSVRMRLGVDVEAVRGDMDMPLVARSHFSIREFGDWSRLADGEREAGFFRCWVRKEAYLKGLGTGVSRGLNNFSVSVSTDAPAALLEDELSPGAPARWVLRDLAVEQGFGGCVAVEGKPLVLRYFDGKSF